MLFLLNSNVDFFDLIPDVVEVHLLLVLFFDLADDFLFAVFYSVLGSDEFVGVSENKIFEVYAFGFVLAKFGCEKLNLRFNDGNVRFYQSVKFHFFDSRFIRINSLRRQLVYHCRLHHHAQVFNFLNSCFNVLLGGMLKTLVNFHGLIFLYSE